MWKQIKKVFDALLSSLAEFISHAHMEQGRTEHWLIPKGKALQCRLTHWFLSLPYFLCEDTDILILFRFLMWKIHCPGPVLSYRRFSVLAFGTQLPCYCQSCSVLWCGCTSLCLTSPQRWLCTLTIRTCKYVW